MVYELRTYYANPGKMPALNQRFATKTISLFRKHGMKVIGFWHPESQEEDVLVYILAFESPEQMKQAWKDFADDPDWQKAKAQSEKDGALLAKIESQVLHPTDYSPLR